MKNVIVNVKDNRDPQQPLVHKLRIDRSGFIYLSHERVRFSANILDLEASEDTLRVYMREDGMVVQSMPYYLNFLYQRVLHELPLLFKSFSAHYEEIDIRDQIYYEGSLYVVKFTNFNGSFRLNNVS